MTTNKLTAVAMSLAAGLCATVAHSGTANAGVGGSNDLIEAAVQSGSVDAIIAEVERTESLICVDCVATVSALTNDSRQDVRLVAAWWFASRPGLLLTMSNQMATNLSTGNAEAVRNAADFLGRIKSYAALPALATAIARTDLTVDAKQSIVNAVQFMAHTKGNGVLQTAMTDADPTVRASATAAWRSVLGQTNATPIEAMLNDTAAGVRAQAAQVLGGMNDANARAALEGIVVNDTDAFTRRNAAWALGQIGQLASQAALTTASSDPSPVVRQVAKAALANLR